MIELENVCAGYSGTEILHNISVRFEKGEITVVIGSNGCGKSTLLKVLSSIVPISGGCISIDGINLHDYSGKKLAQTIAVLPQTRNVPNISVQRMILQGRFPYLSYPHKYRKSDFDVAEYAMTRIGISNLKNKKMQELSGGECQKVFIAMALTQTTPFILFDEPTVYLDIRYQLDVMKIVRELKNDGKTVIMVLHDLNLALHYADKIAVIQDGALRAIGTPNEIMSERIIDEVFGVNTVVYKNDIGETFYTFSSR